MRLFSRMRLWAGFLVLAGFLAACDNAEERSEAHTKRGLALMESGEPAKAMLEFRNALQLNQDAIEPRLEFAKLLLLENDFEGAAGNFLRVVELDANNLEARRSLGRIMLLAGNQDEAARHIDAAFALDAQDLEVRGLKASLEMQLGNTDAAAELATALIAEDPGNPMASAVLATTRMEATDYSGAIGWLDPAIERTPGDFGLQFTKLSALEAAGDMAGVGDQLKAMIAQFPENLQLVKGLVEWHLTQNDLDGAETVLRGQVDRYPGEPNHALDVVRFLNDNRGSDAARAELNRLVTLETPHRVTFARSLADFEYQNGNPQAAIERLETLAAGNLEGDEGFDVKTQLAEYLRSAGQESRAFEIAAEILVDDPKNVEALRLRAIQFLEQDDPESAIRDLRSALDEVPQNPGILMLLATAHERNGSISLAQERLALAVQTSGAGVVESLRYADFLSRQDKADVAEVILQDSLNSRGPDKALLSGLAQLKIRNSDWGGAEEIAATLEANFDDEEARNIANEIRISVLSGQEKFEESIGVLRNMWDSSGQATSAMENLVRNYVQSGQVAEAKNFLTGILAEEPDQLRANLLLGAVYAFEGDTAQAERYYRKVIEDHPEMENGYGALAGLLRSLGRDEEADAVIEEGIRTAQDISRLLFAQASQKEAEGDYEGAIAIYAQLYDANRVSDVLANNYASLLAEHRDDPESLETAYAVAKRLRTSTEPAVQDTYGWVLYKRGEYERALQPLQAAADGLPGNPVVLFHLGMVLEKLGQRDQAIETLTRVVELADGSGLPQVAEAKEVLEGLANQAN